MSQRRAAVSGASSASDTNGRGGGMGRSASNPIYVRGACTHRHLRGINPAARKAMTIPLEPLGLSQRRAAVSGALPASDTNGRGGGMGRSACNPIYVRGACTHRHL
ncbi:MAG: hypothetical protein RIC55_04595, partial [Pirellulaceae bacterium]